MTEADVRELIRQELAAQGGIGRMLTDVMPLGDVPTVIPSQYDHLIASQNGRARKVLAPEVTAAAAALGGALNGLVAQAEADIAPALANIGYLPPVAFAAGIFVDSTRLTVERGGQIYAALKSAMPFTTTATFNPAQWRLLQGVTGADLAANGAGMVGGRQQGTSMVLRTLLAKAFEVLTPEDAGAVAGNDSPAIAAANRVAINRVLAEAALQGKKVRFSGGATYHVDVSVGPILFPSRVTVEGARATIKSVSDNALIACSESYISNSPTGYLTIDSLFFEGTGVGPNQHGFLLRDYWSRLSNCRAINTGGRGFAASHTNQAGVSVSSTLVENRWIDCSTNNCVGESFYLGAAGNNRLTDCYLINPIARQATGSTASHIFIGSAAGWKVDGVHTYGGSPARAVQIANVFATEIGSIYIEGGWTEAGLSMTSAQREVFVASAIIVAGPEAVAANASLVRLGRSAAFPSVDLSLGSIKGRSLAGASVKAFHVESPSTMRVRAVSVVVGGDGSIALPGVADMQWYRGTSGNLSDVVSRGQLFYEGRTLPGPSGKSTTNGAAAQSAAFDIPYIGAFSQVVVDVVISSRAFNNGAVRATYIGKAIVNTKADTDAWVVRLVDVVAATGFSVLPNASVSNDPLSNSARRGRLVVSYTFASSDAQGACHFLLHPETS